MVNAVAHKSIVFSLFQTRILQTCSKSIAYCKLYVSGLNPHLPFANEYEYEYFIQHKTYSTMFIAIKTTIYSEEQWLCKCFQKSMKVYLVVS